MIFKKNHDIFLKHFSIKKIIKQKSKIYFYTCCISTLARFELIRLKRDVFRFLSEWSRFNLRCLCNVLRAILLWVKSRFLPPVLILVFSNGVLRNVTWSPPLNINWRTCIWYKPCTGSPFICVMRSPGLKPASKAGLDWSTAYKIYEINIIGLCWYFDNNS